MAPRDPDHPMSTLLGVGPRWPVRLPYTLKGRSRGYKSGPTGSCWVTESNYHSYSDLGQVKIESDCNFQLISPAFFGLLPQPGRVGTAHRTGGSIRALDGRRFPKFKIGTTHPDRYAIHTLGMGGAYTANG
jgi:hypothetical protein